MLSSGDRCGVEISSDRLLEGRSRGRTTQRTGQILRDSLPMASGELERIREIALALPEVNERLSHGAPCFFVRDKRPICYFHDADFARDGRVSLWCPAPAGVREDLVAAEPERFFAPTSSASGVFRDWIGVYLDTQGDLAVDWTEIATIVEEAYRLPAPKNLAAGLDDALPKTP